MTKIRDQISRDCYASPDAEDFIEIIDMTIAPRNEETAAKFQCVVDAIDEVWTENNLGPEWNETKATLTVQIAKLSNCTTQQ